MKAKFLLALVSIFLTGLLCEASTAAEKDNEWQVFSNEKWRYQLLYPAEGWKVELGCESEGTPENVIKKKEIRFKGCPMNDNRFCYGR